MQTNVIQYNYYSADKTSLVFTMGDVLIMHSNGMVTGYGRLDAIWMLLHSTAQSHNTQTEFSKTGIDGGAIKTEENYYSHVRGLRIVLLF